MKHYMVGEAVRLIQDGSSATVTEVIAGPYEIEAGQQLGGGSADRAGEMSYRVKDKKGSVRLVRDRDVMNPPDATPTTGSDPEALRKDKYRGEPTKLKTAKTFKVSKK